MAVDVDTQGSFQASAPHLLFKLPQGAFDIRTLPAVNYDVTADGEKFVFVGRAAGPAVAPQIQVILNLFEDLRKSDAPQK